MDMLKALETLGEMLGKHVAENICEASQSHVEKFLHSLPEFLGGEPEKKELLDQVEKLGADIATSVIKHYLKVDIKKYF